MTPKTKSSKVRFRILLYSVVFILLALPTIHSISSNLERAAIHRAMGYFQNVSEIQISRSSSEVVIRQEEIDFSGTKMLLNPFGAGSIGISASERRTFQRRSHDVFVSMTYSVDGNALFSARIYIFTHHPLSAQSRTGGGAISNNIFTINGYYAVAFMSNSNFMLNLGDGIIEFLQTWSDEA